MMVTHIIIAFLISLLLVALFSRSFRRGEGFGTLFAVFVVIFLASWAGGLWLTPVGPPVWGVAWIPFLVMGLLFALLIAANGGLNILPPTPKGDPSKGASSEIVAPDAVHLFVWMIAALLIIAIFARYFWSAVPVAY